VSLLVMFGGLLILIQGVLDLANIVPLIPPGPILDLINALGGYTVVGVISIASGLLVIAGGWMISQKQRKNGSLLALVFSVIGFAGGGGFIVGTILGFLGGLRHFRAME